MRLERTLSKAGQPKDDDGPVREAVPAERIARTVRSALDAGAVQLSVQKHEFRSKGASRIEADLRIRE